MTTKILSSTTTRLEHAGAWPVDFFTALCKAMPDEFTSGTASCRGYYKDIVDFTCHVVLLPEYTQCEVYDFKPDTRNKEASKDGLKDFLGDIRKVAKKQGLKEVRSPASLSQSGSFLLGRTRTSIRLMVTPVA